MTGRRTDDWGQVILDPNYVYEYILEGHDVWSLMIDHGDALDEFNKNCELFDKPCVLKPYTKPTVSAVLEHNKRSEEWFVPEELMAIDIRDFLLTLCTTDIERDRVNQEMDLYEARNLKPLLALMIYLVNYFRENKIVWGVGRGSSVASYCLFLIGIHRVDSIKYGLDIREFLK